MFGGGGNSGSSSCSVLNIDLRVSYMQMQILDSFVSFSEHSITIIPIDNSELLKKKIHNKFLADGKL